MVRCWHPLAPNRPRFGELRAALHAAVHVDPTALTEPADPDGTASAAAAELAARLAALAVSAAAAAATAQCAIDHEYDTDLPIAIRRPDTDSSRPSSSEHQYDEELPSSLRQDVERDRAPDVVHVMHRRWPRAALDPATERLPKLCG